MIIINKKFAFLHVPKTGGNWVTKIINESGLDAINYGDKHATYDYICGADFVNYSPIMRFSTIPKFRNFCVVRNSLKWCESWFKYQS